MTSDFISIKTNPSKVREIKKSWSPPDVTKAKLVDDPANEGKIGEWSSPMKTRLSDNLINRNDYEDVKIKTDPWSGCAYQSNYSNCPPFIVWQHAIWLLKNYTAFLM